MSKEINVIIIGLPLFAKRLAEELSNYYPKGRFIQLDTYYSKFDKLKMLWHIRKADVVFSINGSLSYSKVFDMVLKNKIPLIMNWVGTDVLKAEVAFNSNNYRKEYIEKAIHYCEVDWIKKEVEVIGINAEIVNFASFNKTFEFKNISSEQLTILSYISEKRAKFYGIDSFLNLAKKFKNIHFIIAGTSAIDYLPLPPNVEALGWVKNMDEVFDRSHICLRFPEHDGLSTFILEALARGKQVLYKYPFNYCYFCPTDLELEKNVDQILTDFNNQKDLTNIEGAHFIQENFNSEVILKGLINRFITLK